MKEAPIPKNEKERLASLRKTRLSEISKENLDKIVATATNLFNVPISTVTFVDYKKEKHFAAYGLRKKEGSRAASFCGHAIAGKKELMIVPDTLKDPRFKDNPMVVKGLKIRFYAALVLKSAEGYNIGTFCIKDKVPRTLNKKQIQLLKDLGALVQREISILDVLKLNAELNKAEQKLKQSAVQKKRTENTKNTMFNVLEGLNAEKNKLEDAMTKLNKLDKMEETIINAGHELKSPLVPINLQLQLLLEGDFGSINSKQKKSLKMIRGNAEQLGLLINDITDIAKIESKALVLTYEPISLEKIIRQQVSALRLKSRDNGVSLIMKPVRLPTIYADRLRMAQVITNLLNNAIKFTPVKGKIVVMAKKVKDMVQVQVSDNGIGIKKEIQKRLFVRFFQVDSSISRKYGGTGLGLSICKGIIEAHGGRIWVNSAGLGKGSTFSFTLPMGNPKQASNNRPLPKVR